MAKKIVDETLKFTIVVNGNEAQKEYGKLNRANKKLLDETKDLEAQAEKLRKANKQKTDEYKQLTATIDANNKKVKEAETRMSELTKEIGINELTQRQLRKESSRLRGILSNLTPGTDKWKEYTKQLQSVQARQANLREDMRATEMTLEDQENALGQLTIGFGQFFSGLKSGNYADASEGLRTITGGIKGATRAAIAFIATPLGAAIAALAGVGILAKTWFDYNTQAVEALRLTQQITGLSDQAADNARVRAEALSETFGTDFKETLETAKTLSQQFGISFDEALNQIETGLVRGQKNNDQFFDSLKEYPTFFNQAGFSVDEFRKVIETGYNLGIYTDKLPDALKEADISLKEQTTATRDALANAFGASFTDDILNRIKTGEITTKQALEEISAQADKTGLNMQQNAQLTADVFRGAGEDAGGAIKIFEAYDQALNKNQKELTESQKITEQQIKATTELKQVSSALFSTGDKGFGLLIDKAKLFGTKLLVDILKTGIDVYNWFVDLNNQSGTFSAILKGIGIAATSSFEIIGIGLKLIKEQFGTLGDFIEGLFSGDFDKMSNAFVSGFEKTGNAIAALKDKAINNFNEVKNAFEGGNQLERKTLVDFITDDPNNPDSNTPLGNNPETNPDTPEGKIARSEEDIALVSELETNKQEALQDIRDKYQQEHERKHAQGLQNDLEREKAIADQKKKVIENLNAFKKKQMLDSLSAAANASGALSQLLGEESQAGKAFASVQSLINTYLGASQVVSDPKVPTFLKPIYVASTIALGLKQVSEINKTKVPTAKGFEDGLYPVTRKQDGKRFNAQYSTNTSTRLVNDPAILVGERPEMIIDPDTLTRMNPSVVDYILQLAGKRPIQGFETGKYNDTETTPTPVPSNGNDAVMAMLATAVNRLVTEGVEASVNYGLHNEIERQKLQDKLDNTINQSKN